jgi:hypothetical protein
MGGTEKDQLVCRAYRGLQPAAASRSMCAGDLQLFTIMLLRPGIQKLSKYVHWLLRPRIRHQFLFPIHHLLLLLIYTGCCPDTCGNIPCIHPGDRCMPPWQQVSNGMLLTLLQSPHDASQQSRCSGQYGKAEHSAGRRRFDVLTSFGEQYQPSSALHMCTWIARGRWHCACTTAHNTRVWAKVSLSFKACMLS